MNYKKLYNKIISNAKDQHRSKKQNYFESHHIKPKCFGGDNSKSNLVLLTAREHFLCHFLLVKMFPKHTNEWRKMLHAFMLMKGFHSKQKRYINGRIYEYLKTDYSKYSSTKRKGTKLSTSHKKKISESMLGHKTSEETKKLISNKAKTRKRKPFSLEYRQRMSSIMKNRLA